MDDGSASVFCFTPLRVTVSELDRLRAETPPRESSPGSGCSAPSIPPGPCPVCPRLEQEFEPWRQAAYWQGMHRRALGREAKLKAEAERLQALLRLREQQLFGRKTETAAATEVAASRTTPVETPPPRSRGQRPGKPGPKRRDSSHLPAVVEDIVLPPDLCRCSRCGQPFDDFPGTEDAIILEVDVRAHRRVIRRRRYRPTCSCAAYPGIVTAPPPPKVFAKGMLGVSIWVNPLLDKDLFYRPTYRLLADWAAHGLDRSSGTVSDGLRHLVPPFEPVYAAVVRRSQTQPLWHADETRWLVFAGIEGKVGSRWYLWAFHSPDAVVFVLAAGRSHDVPQEHFGPVESRGILVVDRYKAYQAIDEVRSGLIILAFCRAHARRDFVRLARSWPDQDGWALEWVAEIGTLYHLNDERLKVRDDASAFAAADGALRAAVTSFGKRGEEQLRAPDVHPARQKVLEGLGDHWTGLTVFLDHPEVPMDNNTAERSERGPVVGRKNYHGSGSVWSGRLAAMPFSLSQTLCLWGLNPRPWLPAYLTACAEAGRHAPADVDGFPPWHLTAERRRAWGGDEEIPAPDTS